MGPLLRALVWLVISAGLLLAGFAVLAGTLLAVAVIPRGELPGQLQREALGTVFSAIATQALLPELAVTLVTWIVAVHLVPALDRTHRALALSLFAIAALWFPAIGHYSFTVWTPTSARDYAFTVLLVAGGVALALWTPRIVSPALAPGCFTAASKRSMVAAR